MNTEQFKNMTNKELFQYCKDNDITVQAKNPHKPNKTELLNSISSSTNTADEDIKVDDEPQVLTDDDIGDIDLPEDDKDLSPLKQAMSKEDKKKKDLENMKNMRSLQRVIIRLNVNYGDKVMPNQMHEVSWGNSLFGSNHEVFPLNEEWHLTKGAIDALDRILYRKPIIDKKSGEIIGTEPIKKYFIEKLQPLTRKDIDNMKSAK